MAKTTVCRGAEGRTDPAVGSADGSTHTPGRLTFNDTWYPGWKMTVDGDERPPLRADFGLSAVDETLSAAPATDRPDWLHCHGLALAFFRLNQ
jgi:hypothetical protein